MNAPQEPLTEDQIWEIFHAAGRVNDNLWFIDFARAIERAHGIGGRYETVLKRDETGLSGEELIPGMREALANLTIRK